VGLREGGLLGGCRALLQAACGSAAGARRAPRLIAGVLGVLGSSRPLAGGPLQPGEHGVPFSVAVSCFACAAALRGLGAPDGRGPARGTVVGAALSAPGGAHDALSANMTGGSGASTSQPTHV